MDALRIPAGVELIERTRRDTGGDQAQVQPREHVGHIDLTAVAALQRADEVVVRIVAEGMLGEIRWCAQIVETLEEVLYIPYLISHGGEATRRIPAKQALCGEIGIVGC
jgi:hypothetical protein